jgi:sugar phosphate isomerase/epimerase
MVHLGVSSMFFHEYPYTEILDLIEEAGFDSLEFWPETPDFWIRGLPRDELKAVLSSHPALSHLAVHTPILDLNPCSINPGVAALSVRYSLEAYALAEDIGASVFTVHPGRRTAKRVPAGPDYDRFEYYLSCLREAAAGGKTRVAMENMEPAVNSLICRPREMSELLEREPWLWFTLDTSHAMAGPSRDIERFIGLCRDRIVNIHLGRAGGGRVHLPLNRDPEIARVLSMFRETGYEGNITFELEDRNFDHDLSSEEKVTLLARELGFVRECLE